MTLQAENMSAVESQETAPLSIKKLKKKNEESSRCQRIWRIFENEGWTIQFRWASNTFEKMENSKLQDFGAILRCG